MSMIRIDLYSCLRSSRRRRTYIDVEISVLCEMRIYLHTWRPKQPRVAPGANFISETGPLGVARSVDLYCLRDGL